jgi:hypothetical protein
MLTPVFRKFREDVGKITSFANNLNMIYEHKPASVAQELCCAYRNMFGRCYACLQLNFSA